MMIISDARCTLYDVIVHTWCPVTLLPECAAEKMLLAASTIRGVLRLVSCD